MNAEVRAIYEQQAQLQKEREDLDVERELLFAILAATEKSEEVKK
jgi:hypothetical protein